MPAVSTDEFQRHGFTWVRGLINGAQLSDLIVHVERLENARAGVRNLLQVCPAVKSLAKSQAVRHLVTELLGGEGFAVRGILFDKSPAANWRVAWHQDVTITVKELSEVNGFGPTSTKDGAPHTQAPAWLLERMVTLRLHLDDCDKSNGALKVLPGSHRSGKLSAGKIEDCRSASTENLCTANAGDALFMRPLLLHASSPAEKPRHRRVVHIEFAMDELPGGLEWAERA